MIFRSHRPTDACLVRPVDSLTDIALFESSDAVRAYGLFS